MDANWSTNHSTKMTTKEFDWNIKRVRSQGDWVGAMQGKYKQIRKVNQNNFSAYLTNC
jgi:hypothetical protein